MFASALLLEDIALARLDGSYGTLFARLGKTDLLILDDFGLAPLAGARGSRPPRDHRRSLRTTLDRGLLTAPPRRVASGHRRSHPC